MEKQYSDEEFIYLIGEQIQESMEENAHKNKIKDGYIILNETKIPFEQLPVSEDEFSMWLPSNFEPMKQELAELKYSSVNRPDFILSNESGTITFTFSHKADKLANEEVEQARNQLQFFVTQMHPQTKIIDSSTVYCGEHKLAYFEFITPAIDTEIFNFMFCFSLSERFLLGSFNCIIEEMEDWREIFLQILESTEFMNSMNCM